MKLTKKFPHAIASSAFVALFAAAFAAIPFTAVHAEEGGQSEASFMNELTGSTNSILTFGSGQNTEFQVAAGYSRTLMSCLQGTGETALLVKSGTTILDLLVGPTLNYAVDDTGLHNAVYLSLLAGVALEHTSVATVSDTTLHFAYKAALGKRFEIWKDIAWLPEFNVSGTTAKDSSGNTTKPTFALVPVQFAFSF